MLYVPSRGACSCCSLSLFSLDLLENSTVSPALLIPSLLAETGGQLSLFIISLLTSTDGYMSLLYPGRG